VHKDLQFRPAKEALDQARFAPHPFHGVAPCTPELREMEAADMAEFDPLELWPEPLVGMQRRGIGRQALQVEAVRCASREELLDGLAAVDRRALPDHDHPARDLAQQRRENRDDVCSIESAVLAVEVHLALGREGGDGGEMVAGAPLLQDRCPASWRIGAPDTGSRRDTRRIDPEDRLALGVRPLLLAGHVSSRHWAMAASSRGCARRLGCWGLQRMALSNRPTGAAWYMTPHSTRTTSATRFRVQTWPRNP
jgi:hypothetical protein